MNIAAWLGRLLGEILVALAPVLVEIWREMKRAEKRDRIQDSEPPEDIKRRLDDRLRAWRDKTDARDKPE